MTFIMQKDKYIIMIVISILTSEITLYNLNIPVKRETSKLFCLLFESVENSGVN